MHEAHLGLLEFPDHQDLAGERERLENLAQLGPTGYRESRVSMGFQKQRVLEARLDLLDSLDPPELNQFNFPMDPSSLRALRARQVHQDQPDLEGVKGHWGIRDHPGGTDLLVLQANAVSKAETEYLEFRDLKDYREAAEQLTSDGETRRVPRPQAPNLFTLAELLVVIGAAPGELAISFVYPRNRSKRKNSSLEHNAILRYTGSSRRPSMARR